MSAQLNILIAPLDWGLGHTTRCIPIIAYLQSKGHRVVAAAAGVSAQLLQENFPDLNIIPLQGYGIHYSNKQWSFNLKIVSQIPKILKAIRLEKKWLAALLQQQSFDVIIADNRYGLYDSSVKSIILTHQLTIKSGYGNVIDSFLRQLHYKMLLRFDACGVVDIAMNKGWSGDLSHPNVLPNNAHYMGILSQFSNTLAPTIASSKGSIEAQRILIVLSGPEPMRSQLAYLLWRQIQDMTNYQFVFVAGNPKATVPIGVPSHIQFYSHLKADALGCEFQRAALVVCRSGYSTVMDLAVLQKKALLIPTPGQTEQMYLAQYLSSKGIGYCTSQQHVFLPDDIKKALLTLNMSTVPDDYELYQKVLDCLLP